jgi:hypothetical protein
LLARSSGHKVYRPSHEILERSPSGGGATPTVKNTVSDSEIVGEDAAWALVAYVAEFLPKPFVM